MGTAMTRRRLLGLWLAGLTAPMAECGTERSSKNILMLKQIQQKQDRQVSKQGRLLARPAQQTQTASLGLQELGLDAKRDGLLYVPATYLVERPAPLVVMLHGAGGDARGGLTPFLHLADAAGLILLAPPSVYLSRYARSGFAN